MDKSIGQLAQALRDTAFGSLWLECLAAMFALIGLVLLTLGLVYCDELPVVAGTGLLTLSGVLVALSGAKTARSIAESSEVRSENAEKISAETAKHTSQIAAHLETLADQVRRAEAAAKELEARETLVRLVSEVRLRFSRTEVLLELIRTQVPDVIAARGIQELKRLCLSDREPKGGAVQFNRGHNPLGPESYNPGTYPSIQREFVTTWLSEFRKRLSWRDQISANDVPGIPEWIQRGSQLYSDIHQAFESAKTLRILVGDAEALLKSIEASSGGRRAELLSDWGREQALEVIQMELSGMDSRMGDPARYLARLGLSTNPRLIPPIENVLDL